MGEDFLNFVFVGVVHYGWRLWILLMQICFYVRPEQTHMKFIVHLAAWWQVQFIYITTILLKDCVRSGKVF